MEQTLISNQRIIKLRGKKRHKPLYKKFNQIFENPQSRKKIFKFKKKKWEKLQNHLKKRKSYRNRYNLFDSNSKSIITWFSRKYRKQHKNLLHSAKKLNLFYGGLKRKYLKTVLVKINKKRTFVLKKQGTFGNLNFFFVDFMESRLEAILYRSFFIKNIKTARQLIKHGYVYVNKQLVRNGSCLIKKNDIIEVDIKLHEFVLNNIKNSGYWPIPQKNISINYKTLQILYTGFPYPNERFPSLFNFKLNVRDVIHHYTYN